MSCDAALVLTAALQCALARHDLVTARNIALQLPVLPALNADSAARADSPASGASSIRPAWQLCAELATALAGTTRQRELAARALAMMPADTLANQAAPVLDMFATAEALHWVHEHNAAVKSMRVTRGPSTARALRSLTRTRGWRGGM